MYLSIQNCGDGGGGGGGGGVGGGGVDDDGVNVSGIKQLTVMCATIASIRHSLVACDTLCIAA